MLWYVVVPFERFLSFKSDHVALIWGCVTDQSDTLPYDVDGAPTPEAPAAPLPSPEVSADAKRANFQLKRLRRKTTPEKLPGEDDVVEAWGLDRSN